MGLPIVLLAWTIRLIFGKGRAGHIWGTLDDWANSSISKFLIKVLAALAIIGFIGLLIYTYGWVNVSLIILAIIVGIGVIVGLLLGVFWLGDKSEEWRQNRPPRPPKPQKEAKRPNPVLVWLWTAVKNTFVVLTWIPKMLLIGLWQVLSFLGLMIVATYKRFCPIVEFA